MEIHETHFPPDCEDIAWIPEVGKRGWVILTKDAEIRNNQLKLITLLQASTATFILSAKKLSGPEMAQAFIAAIPDILRLLQKFSVPFVARISAGGRVSILLTYSGMIKKIK